MNIIKHVKNKDLVIILTSQFLSMNHGPTKTALDRAYILQKYYGKKVFLINTAEMRGMAGEMPVSMITRSLFLAFCSTAPMLAGTSTNCFPSWIAGISGTGRKLYATLE